MAQGPRDVNLVGAREQRPFVHASVVRHFCRMAAGVAILLLSRLLRRPDSGPSA